MGLWGTDLPASQKQARGPGILALVSTQGRPGCGGWALRLPGELVNLPSCHLRSSVCCDERNGVLGGDKCSSRASGRWCSTDGVSPHTRGPHPDASLRRPAGGLTHRVTTRRWKEADPQGPRHARKLTWRTLSFSVSPEDSASLSQHWKAGCQRFRLDQSRLPDSPSSH